MKKILAVIGIIIGLYFLNYPFQLIKIPEIISKLDPWIIFAGGILIVVAGIKSLFTPSLASKSSLVGV